MIHITERDRQLVDAAEIHQADKAAFERALSAGEDTAALYVRLLGSAAELKRIERKPVKFICADCGDEEEMIGHVIYTVVAVCRHLKEEDRYVSQEFDRDHLRHLVLCGDCDAEWHFDEYLHERKFDGERLPHMQASAEIARLKTQVDQLEDRVLELSEKK
jgi:hypothetical protein